MKKKNLLLIIPLIIVLITSFLVHSKFSIEVSAGQAECVTSCMFETGLSEADCILYFCDGTGEYCTYDSYTWGGAEITIEDFPFPWCAEVSTDVEMCQGVCMAINDEDDYSLECLNICSSADCPYAAIAQFGAETDTLYCNYFGEVPVADVNIQLNDYYSIVNNNNSLNIQGFAYTFDGIASVGIREKGNTLWNSCTSTFQEVHVDSQDDYTGYWTLDQETGAGAFILDESLGEFHGTPTGDAIYSADGINGSWQFDGWGDYITLDADLSIDLPSGSEDRTVLAWVKPISYIHGINHVVHFGNTTDNQAWGLAIWQEGGFGPHEWGAWDNRGDVPLDEWSFLAITLSDNEVKKHYQDGEFVGTAINQPLTTNSVIPRIGINLLGEEGFHGNIDEVRIYNRALTEQEINDIYNSTRDRYSFSCPTQELPNEDMDMIFEIQFTDTNDPAKTKIEEYLVKIDITDGTDILSYFGFDDPSAPFTDNEGRIAEDMSESFQNPYPEDGYYREGYNSSEGYLSLDDATGLFDFSGEDAYFKVEAMVKPTALSSWSRIVSKNNDENTESLWVIGMDDLGGLYCGIWDTIGEQRSFFTGDFDIIPLNTWSKIACEWDASTRTLKGYIDDLEVKSQIFDVGVYMPESTAGVGIGGKPTNGFNSFTGLIDEVVIYSAGAPLSYPVITTDQNYILLSNTVEHIFSGIVTDFAGVESVEFSPYGQDNWSECQIEAIEYEPNGHEYSCTTAALSDEEVYVYSIRATNTNLQTTPPEQYIYFTAEVDTNQGLRDLVAYWDFNNEFTPYIDYFSNEAYDNGTDLYPHTGYMYNGIKTNSGHLSVEDSLGLFNFGTFNTKFKVEAMVKPTALASWSRIVGKNNNDEDENVWVMGTDDNGGLYCGLWDTSNIHHGITTGPANQIPIDSWSKVSCEWNSVSRELIAYINDVSVSQDTLTGGVYIQDSLGEIGIGARANGGDNFQGYIDDVKIYSFETGDGYPPVITFNNVGDHSQVNSDSVSITGTIVDPDLVESAEYIFVALPYGYVSGNIDTDYGLWTSLLPDDGVWSSNTESFTIEKTFEQEGVYWLYLRAIDTFGRESYHETTGWIANYPVATDYAMGNLRVNMEFEDKSSPDIVVSRINPNPTTKREIFIKGFVKDYEYDTQSSISSVEYSINSGDWAEAEFVESNDEGTQKNFLIHMQDLDIGIYSVEIRATDSSGNRTDRTYDSCYIDCMDIPNNYEAWCQYQCRNQHFSENETVTLEVIAEENPPSVLLEDLLSISNIFNVNFLESTAIIGTNFARIPTKYTTSTQQELYTNSSDFGGLYGERYKVNISESIDGNLWLVFLNEDFAYYNIETQTLTRYPSIMPEGWKAINITEFEYSGSRYLLIESDGNYPLSIYEIGSTPENLSDDGSLLIYNTVFGETNSKISKVQIDNRGAYPRITGLVTSIPAVINVDTKGIFDNLSTHTYTLYDTEVSGTGIVGYLFDEERDLYITSDYTTGNLSIIDDNGTPDDRLDQNSVVLNGANVGEQGAYWITDSGNDWYWVSGNHGIYAVNIPDLEEVSDINTDADIISYFSETAFVGQSIQSVYQVDNTEQETKELIISTTQGTIYILDFNDSITFENDDRLHLIPPTSEISNSYTRILTLYNYADSLLWRMVPGKGLYKTEIVRDYEDSAIIILEPNLNSGVTHTDHITVLNILGSLIPNIDIDVSNTGGSNWFSTFIGYLFSFPTSGSDIKIRLTLNKGSSPKVESVNVKYATYSEDPLTNADLNIDYPEIIEVNDDFDVEINYLDDLGFVPNKTEDVDMKAYDANTHTEVMGCFDYDFPTQVQAGEANIVTTALCTGTYYIIASANDKSAQGANMTVFEDEETPIQKIIRTILPDDEELPLCGNGIIDEGEECDYMEDTTYPRCSELNSKYVGGSLYCSRQCTLEYDECREDADTVIDRIVDEAIPRSRWGISASSVMRAIEAAIPVIIVAMSATFIPYFFTRVILGILSAIGLRKGKNKYGFIYNSVTKEPLSQAIVRIYKDDKLFDTRVTGVYGEILGELEPGSYTLTVQKPGFEFPSTIIRNSPDGIIPNVYTGTLTVTSVEPEILVGIPIDPVDVNFFVKFALLMFDKGSSIIKLLKVLIFSGLFAYSLMIYLANPVLLNLVIVILYIIIIVILLISLIERQIRYGRLFDRYGNIVANKTIHLIDAEFNTVASQRITDELGRFRFVVPPGKYQIRIDGKDLEEIYELKKSPSIINTDLVI